MLILPVVFSEGFSQCIYNDDWPDAPCFDMGPVSHLEFNKAWAPYYDHKGSEWMETKRIELNQVLEQGVIEEWVEKLENHNVYQYYLSRNEIPSSLAYDSFFVKYDPTFIPSEQICREGDKLVDGVCIVSNPQPVYGLDCEVLHIWNYAIDDCNFMINSINFIFSLLLPIGVVTIGSILITLKYKKRF